MGQEVRFRVGLGSLAERFSRGSSQQPSRELSKAIDGELHERRVGGLDFGFGSAKADTEFSPAEEESAFATNRLMCVCQIAISAAQMALCAWTFHTAPVRNAVNIAFCALSLPLAVAGLSALHAPEEEHSVLVMHWYQLFFVLRAGLVSFDFACLLHTRVRDGVTTQHVVLAAVLLVTILVLQCLNSLLVLAVIRIMRKKRNLLVLADANAAHERTPLLS